MRLTARIPILELLIITFTLLPRTTSAKGRQCRLVPRSGVLTAQQPLGTSPATFTYTQSASGTVSLASGVATGTGTVTGTGSASEPTMTQFNYGTQKVIGVNLGGWFVMEPWITPSMFENTNNTNIVDEYTFGQMQDQGVATAALTKHWETWLTEADFITMAKAGINHVRIPLGYWSIPTGEDVTPYTPGAWPYFLQALNWAHTHGIYTLVDLHGAPGSQNGYDNSGQRTPNPQWGTSQSNINRTIADIVFLVNNTIGLIDVIELVNEPAGFLGDTWVEALRGYYQSAYSAIRGTVGGTGLKILLGDGFIGVNDWEGFLTPDTGAQGVLMDYHQYQIFSVPQLERSQIEHIDWACGLIPTLQGYAQSPGGLWTIMGEWSGAMTDCAKWLNGRNTGARWDGSLDGSAPLGSCDGYTGSMSTFSDDYKTFLRKYWEVQSVLGDSVNGNIWWTWKAENADEWDYSKGLEGGWIPQDPTERIYPGICAGASDNLARPSSATSIRRALPVIPVVLGLMSAVLLM